MRRSSVCGAERSDVKPAAPPHRVGRSSETVFVWRSRSSDACTGRRPPVRRGDAHLPRPLRNHAPESLDGNKIASWPAQLSGRSRRGGGRVALLSLTVGPGLALRTQRTDHPGSTLWGAQCRTAGKADSKPARSPRELPPPPRMRIGCGPRGWVPGVPDGGAYGEAFNHWQDPSAPCQQRDRVSSPCRRAAPRCKAERSQPTTKIPQCLTACHVARSRLRADKSLYVDMGMAVHR